MTGRHDRRAALRQRVAAALTKPVPIGTASEPLAGRDWRRSDSVITIDVQMRPKGKGLLLAGGAGGVANVRYVSVLC